MLTEPIIESFSPIADQDCTVLILGTMPGVESLKSKQYYGHPDNTFWDIIVRILSPELTETEIDNLTYAQKTDLMLSKHIALWDVLQHCNRNGSLDSKIRHEIKNNFELFFAKHPKINKLIFNGQKAEKYFTSCFKHLIDTRGLAKIVLPSTSPSHTLNTFTKLKSWRAVLNI